MATTFKTFSSNDVISTKTLLHEAVPITGAIVSGTYADSNIKNFSHGMFQSVYDYPYLSSSANHIFDVTCGYHTKSPLYTVSTTKVGETKKLNIYNQMAQVLMGYDHTGSIQRFDEDGDLLAGGTKLDSVVFVNFSRLLVKDEIKKGSFSIEFGVGADAPHKKDGSEYTFSKIVKVADTNAQNDFRVNSPAGEYGILYATISSKGSEQANVLTTTDGTQKAGLLYYQAGIAVITSSLFCRNETGRPNRDYQSGMLHASVGTGPLTASVYGHRGVNDASGENPPETFHQLLTGSNISASCDAVRSRIYNVAFNNVTELNSTVYFCRASHNEFNYSANPTYLSASKLRVKQQSTDTPVSYITTVGLYSADNELMACAKLSEPLKKDPTNEMTLRVRLDY